LLQNAAKLHSTGRTASDAPISRQHRRQQLQRPPLRFVVGLAVHDLHQPACIYAACGAFGYNLHCLPWGW
jgi:hypothetical protein